MSGGRGQKAGEIGHCASSEVSDTAVTVTDHKGGVRLAGGAKKEQQHQG